jgi:hypothetical protein
MLGPPCSALGFQAGCGTIRGLPGSRELPRDVGQAAELIHLPFYRIVESLAIVLGNGRYEGAVFETGSGSGYRTARSPCRMTASRAVTAGGQNWVPEDRASSLRASSVDIALR